MSKPVVLRNLLRQKHWQTYRTFCIQYDKAARTIDASLVGSYPSRAQLHRWQSGDLKGLPYPYHCQVLEVMFPGVTAAQMFSPADNDGMRDAAPVAGVLTESALLDLINDRINSSATPRASWCEDNFVNGIKSVGSQDPLSLVVGRHARNNGPDDKNIAECIVRSVATLGKSMQFSDAETAELGRLAGNLVDLQMECSIDIAANGWASVTYCHRVMNLGSRPVKRMTREQWFETTSGTLEIEPQSSGDRKVHIQRIHDTPNMSKFACQFSPAIEPGEVATVSYAAQGGRFLHDHYWRQSVSCYTRSFTLSIRHREVSLLFNCTAIEEQVNGSELSAIEDLVCSDEDGDALIILTRNYLQPGQAVTVRWEVNHAVARPG